jgi:hypothetical protein
MSVNLDQDPSGDFEDWSPPMPLERQLRILEKLRKREPDIQKCRELFKSAYCREPLF